jgi:hypothetical protein
MRKGISRQEEAEIVCTNREGDGDQRKNGKAQEECGEASERNRPFLSFRQPPENLLGMGEKIGAKPWPCERPGEDEHSEDSLNHQQRGTIFWSRRLEHIGLIICLSRRWTPWQQAIYGAE